MKIELTEVEALVLHDWLRKNSGKEQIFDDLTEKYVLWNMECQL